MVRTNGALLTPEEASCYLLYNRSPGLTQDEIAMEKGKNQGQISRILTIATAKIEELKALAEAAGGDPTVVDDYLFQTEALSAADTLAHNA